MAGKQGFAQHKAGLGHGTIDGIDQQQHTIDHIHNPLDFATEVCVAWGVNNVDFGALVNHGRVFGHDGDTTLTLEIVRVHDPLTDLLIFTECS